MDDVTRKLIQSVEKNNKLIVFIATGAGGQALAALSSSVSDPSMVLLEAYIPYSHAALKEFLEREPEQYVSEETAQLMAGRALSRGLSIRPEDKDVIGLACTATIATDRPKKGKHQAFITTWSSEKLTSYSIELKKGARDRSGEESVVSRLLLNALANAAGININLPLGLTDSDALLSQSLDFGMFAQQLNDKKIPFFGVKESGYMYLTNSHVQAVLAGTFNPLHEGHIHLAKTAREILNKPVSFEISASNVDKPPLKTTTLLNRLSQFAGRHSVLISDAPTFLEKSQLYPGATFVVGYDTAIRIIDPRYYDHNQDSMLAALAMIRERGNRFLVAGRTDDAGVFHELEEHTIPFDFADLFISIPQNLFRKDISSTKLRSQEMRESKLSE